MKSKGIVSFKNILIAFLLLSVAVLFSKLQTSTPDMEIEKNVSAQSDLIEAFLSMPLQPLNLSSFELQSDNPKLVIVNFWATWCPPCREEMPNLVRFYDQNHSQGVVVLGIYVQDSPDKVMDFITQMNVKYPIVSNSPEISDLFGNVAVLPTTIIIDAENKQVLDVIQGYISQSTLDKYIDR